VRIVSLRHCFQKEAQHFRIILGIHLVQCFGATEFRQQFLLLDAQANVPLYPGFD
jgi:hypothetical protein